MSSASIPVRKANFLAAAPCGWQRTIVAYSWRHQGIKCRACVLVQKKSGLARHFCVAAGQKWQNFKFGKNFYEKSIELYASSQVD
jgi:hypothetical protein